MNQFSPRISFVFLTFIVGVSITGFWIFSKPLPDVPIPESQKLRNSSFISNPQMSERQKEFWEKELLPRFKELSLEKSSNADNEVYRFVLLPTFDPPIAIRFWRSENRYFLTTKKTDGLGGFGMNKFGKLSYEKTRPLTENESQIFLELLNQSMFWDMPYIDEDEEPVNDGASWIMEGFDNQGFHQVERILPSGKFRERCNYLLKLSGFEADYGGY